MGNCEKGIAWVDNSVCTFCFFKSNWSVGLVVLMNDFIWSPNRTLSYFREERSYIMSLASPVRFLHNAIETYTKDGISAVVRMYSTMKGKGTPSKRIQYSTTPSENPNLQQVQHLVD